MKSILCKTPFAGQTLGIIFFILLLAPEALSQSPVLQYQANYVAASSTLNSYTAFPTNPGTFSTCNSNNYTYTWRNGSDNQLKLVSFTANSKTYVISGISNVAVKLRRVNNANVTGVRNILYSETSASSASSCVTPRQLDFKAPYNDDMSIFLNNNVLNHGTDNIFANASNGDGNNNNIERVDVIFTDGIQSSLPADAGFILCDRGNNNSHDGFRIAAILGIDAGNNPTSFGAVKICTPGNGSNNGSWGHPSISNGNRLLAAYILRKDPADTYLRVSSNVTQEIGGVFFSFSDLGIVANQKIYGYCLLGPDGTVNPTSAQLMNINDAAVYPTGTTEAQGGGLDLISVTSYFGTDQALASSYYQQFNGFSENSSALLQWSLDNVTKGSIISLERSENANYFTSIYSYTFLEIAGKSYKDIPGKGIFYYRLAAKAPNETVIYSRVIQLRIESAEKNWKLYPTFSKSGEKITISNITNAEYTVLIHEINASTIFQTTLSARNRKGEFFLPRNLLTTGIYYISLEKNGIRMPGTEKIIFKAD